MKTGFLKVFIIGAVFLFAGHAAESRENVDRVVAIVNDDIITLSEMNEMVTSINLTNNQNMDQNQVLQQMIEQKLFEQEAEKLGIKVSEAELDAGIAQVKQRFNLNDEQMAEVLQKQNLTMESFREQWRLQTLSNKLLDSQLKNKIVVTDQEIAEYYRQNYNGSGAPAGAPSTAGAPSSGPAEEVRIAHILISANSPDAAARAEKVARWRKRGRISPGSLRNIRTTHFRRIRAETSVTSRKETSSRPCPPLSRTPLRDRLRALSNRPPGITL